MEITPKAIRRAQARLMAKAKVEAAERKISTSDAICEIIERADDPQTIIRAFTKIEVTSSHKPAANAEMVAYLDEAS